MAFLSAEPLHGESQVRMDAACAFGREWRTCIIDASTEIGRSVCKLLTGCLQREFRANQFAVKRLEPVSAPELAAVAA